MADEIDDVAELFSGERGDVGYPKDKKKDPKRLSIERIYQKKSQLEHIILRPDSYIGSVEEVTQVMWVYDKDKSAMIQRNLTYVPGLYKIYDEIIVNAADNKQRDPKMSTIKININPETNMVQVWNDGKGIPVQEHKDEKMFVPTMIFGHLLTSSNYDDSERKVTGGRNGFGAKLCNIFSTKFSVETSCKESRKAFKQTWQNNMSKAGEPQLRTAAASDFTSITFYPDLSKFKMSKLDDDIVALFSRRAYDLAGSIKGVKIILNGERLAVKSFKDYAELYTKEMTDENGDPLKIVYEVQGPRWEVAVALSDKGFQNVSFVNSIATTKGGRHVDNIADQVTKKLVEVVTKKDKKKNIVVKPFQIKNHLWIFVNCLIENPTFDSQTKDTMTLVASKFGSKFTGSDKFFNAVAKCGISDAILSWMNFKANEKLSKKMTASKTSKLKGIPKLDDANLAGTRQSRSCSLFLTEGDSAKSLVVAGLSVLGRDQYGVFPLKGKVLNTRDASHSQISENAEINNLIKILGLQYKESYEESSKIDQLRYGTVIIMTDQDQDGSHIKGLLINFFHHHWPNLLKHGYLEEFITPIVKVTKKNQSLSFYSLPEFEQWKSETDSWAKWNIKYYKGLGTSTTKEAKEYFSDVKRHKIKFVYSGINDDASIRLAFCKKMADNRKEWLLNWMEEKKRRADIGLPESYLYEKDTHSITYSDFVNRELILFSYMDNGRSIPSIMDGLKPGQRKVLFTCFKRNLVKELKVAQLAGSVAELSAYHHGEASLMSTIINLAQNFVGSNNINLLQPIGQFGTRLHGGKDAASPRYIFTALSPAAKTIFDQRDEPLLNRRFDDNLPIEPEFYVPIIPMVLVNGSEGIGTGWSTSVPCYNPADIIDNLRRLLRDEPFVEMNPYFKNWTGQLEKVSSMRYILSGECAVISDTSLEITELPIKVWTQSYKETTLETMVHGNAKVQPSILDYQEYHTDTTVRFVIKMSSDKLAEFRRSGMHKAFKLQSSLATSNLILHDCNGVIKKYETAMEILMDFYHYRLKMYEKRKDYLEGMLTAESQRLSDLARFILEKIEKKFNFEDMNKKDIVAMLIKRGFSSDPVKMWKKANMPKQNVVAEQENDDKEKDDEDEGDGPYYLLRHHMTLFSREEKNKLLKQRDEKLHELAILRKKSPKDLWNDDLDKLEKELQELDAKQREEDAAGLHVSTKPSKGRGKQKTKMLGRETLPSEMGLRIEPEIGETDKAKYRNLDGKKKAKKEVLDEEEPKPLLERLKETMKAKGSKMINMKPSKRRSGSLGNVKVKSEGSPVKKKKKGSGRNPWSSCSENESDDSEADKVIPRERVPQRNVAGKSKKYNFSDDDDDDDEHRVSFSEDESQDDENAADALPEVPVPQRQKSASPSSSSVNHNNGREYAFGGISDDDDDIQPLPILAPPKMAKKPTEPKVKKATAAKARPAAAEKKKPAAKKKAEKMFPSDSDSDDFVPTKKTAAKRKPMMFDDDDESESEVLPAPKVRGTGRSAAPKKYTFDDEDLNSEDDY